MVIGFIVAVAVMVVAGPHRRIHHSQHLQSTAVLEVAPDEDGGKAEEDDVQVGRVVPGDAGLDYFGVSGSSLEAKALEEKFGDQARGDHGGIEGGKEKPG